MLVDRPLKPKMFRVDLNLKNFFKFYFIFKLYIIVLFLYFLYTIIWAFQVIGISGKEPTWQCKRCKRHGFDPWVRKIPWRRTWQPIPIFLPGKCHGQRSLVGYSP